MSPSRPLPDTTGVAVVGGGTAGLAVAVLLGRRGIPVTVLERQPEPAPAPRGEILQPNGLAVLARMGLLDTLAARPCAETVRYHFLRIGHGPLATFDYSELDHPHPTTLVLLPGELDTVLREAATALPTVSLHAGARVSGLCRNGERVTGVRVRVDGAEHTLAARFVAGADGAFSRVRRELPVGGRTVTYPEGYLTGLLPRPAGFNRDGCYYLGRGEILGLFPVSKDALYFFYLLSPAQYTARRAAGDTRWLAERMRAIHPPLGEAALAVGGWRELEFFPCIRVSTGRWYAPGAALLGDAAHSVNPHVAQGRNLALVDAEALAEAITPDLLAGNAPSPARLHRWERQRRPQAEALRALGDELVLFWNAKNPLLAWLRDRSFKGLARNPALRRQVTADIAGMGPLPLSPVQRARLISPW